MGKEIGNVSNMGLEDLQKLYNESGETSQEEVKEEEVVEEVVEESTDETQVEETTEEVTEEVKEEPKENKELEGIKKQLEGLQSLIGKWGNEISEVRKIKEQIPALTQTQKETIVEKMDENFFENLAKDPAGTIKKLIDGELSTRKKQEDSVVNAQIQTKNVVNKVVPDFDKLIPEIGELIKEDTGNENAPEIFKNSVYQNDIPFLISMGKRAQDRAKIKELEGIITGLKKGTKVVQTSPTGVKSTKPVKGDFTQKDISNMSLTELEQLYKNVK